MPLPALPRNQVYFENRSFTADVLERCQAILARQAGGSDGYLILAQGEECFYALLRGGRIVRAGQFTDGRAFDLTISVFEHIASRAESGTFNLYGVEPQLFEALDLVLSRQPALHGNSRYLSLPDLGRTLRREGRDVVLTFGILPEVNVAIFRRGAPHRLFLANHLAPQARGTILEQIDAYLVKADNQRTPAEVAVAIYDLDLESLPLLFAAAADEALPEAPAAPAQATLAVTFRGRTVSRLVLEKAMTTIGRIKECDVIIDNLGVSRIHCAIQRTPEGYVVEDRGSLNGVIVNDETVRRAVLKDGDVILVGKHRVIFGQQDLAPVTPKADQRTLRAYEATVVLDSKMRPDLAAAMGRKGALPLAQPEAEPTGVARDAAPARAFALPKGDSLERGAARVQGRKPADAKRIPAPEAAPEPAVEAPQADPAAEGKRMPRLVFGKDSAFEMVAPIVTIGSGDEVDLRLEGYLVGRSMARIIKDGTGRYRLESLSRLHRPRINGSAVRDEEILLDGDEVRIGKSRFVFSAS